MQNVEQSVKYDINTLYYTYYTLNNLKNLNYWILENIAHQK